MAPGREKEALELIYDELAALRAERGRANGWFDPRLLVTVILAVLSALVVAVGAKATIETRLQTIIDRQAEDRAACAAADREIRSDLKDYAKELLDHRSNLGVHRWNARNQ